MRMVVLLPECNRCARLRSGLSDDKLFQVHLAFLFLLLGFTVARKILQCLSTELTQEL